MALCWWYDGSEVVVRQDSGSQTDSPSCCAAVLGQLRALQQELARTRRLLLQAGGVWPAVASVSTQTRSVASSTPVDAAPQPAQTARAAPTKVLPLRLKVQTKSESILMPRIELIAVPCETQTEYNAEENTTMLQDMSAVLEPVTELVVEAEPGAGMLALPQDLQLTADEQDLEDCGVKVEDVQGACQDLEDCRVKIEDVESLPRVLEDCGEKIEDVQGVALEGQEQFAELRDAVYVGDEVDVVGNLTTEPTQVEPGEASYFAPEYEYLEDDISEQEKLEEITPDSSEESDLDLASEFDTDYGTDGEGLQDAGEETKEEDTEDNEDLRDVDDIEMDRNCWQCGATFLTWRDLERHAAREHLGKSAYRCEHCGKQFSRVTSLQLHIKAVHLKQKPFQCNSCGKSFTKKGNLQRHEQAHGADCRHLCAECGRGFRDLSSLKEHEIAVHRQERPHQCSACNKMFATKSSLYSHILTHTGQKPHHCHICGMNFKSRQQLETHRRTHTGEKPFTCFECGKMFAHAGSLHTHGRTHTGEKPFTCSRCGKAFAYKHTLMAHERTHTGEQPFVCEHCGKKFGRLTSLQSHRRTHSAERPYTCHLCGKGFRRSDQLRCHVLTHRKH